MNFILLSDETYVCTILCVHDGKMLYLSDTYSWALNKYSYFFNTNSEWTLVWINKVLMGYNFYIQSTQVYDKIFSYPYEFRMNQFIYK